jgi:RES domain-containing protein
VARGDQQVWRIAKHTPEFHAADLSGGGAKSTGGRWNSKGKAVVYGASTIALATLETLAHMGDNIAIRNAFLVKINVPAAVWRAREIVEASDLDITWLAEPPGSTTIQFGDDWLDTASAPLLLVPSVIVPEEYNLLINPAHPATAKITAAVARQFVYDPRL